MAEENTEEAPDDTEDSETVASAGDSSAESADASGDTAESPDTATEPLGDDVPEPANEPSIGSEIPVVEPTRVTTADGGEISEPITDISMLLDIPVTLSMEIGQTKISINELLKLGKDSVIELQRMAHEPLDVLVNGTLVAHGEAVVVGDRFGIRLTDVISPQERLRKFG
ncbi:MAG: flagellar motor switch protein FliN [Granulosicoccus sp.]